MNSEQIIMIEEEDPTTADGGTPAASTGDRENYCKLHGVEMKMKELPISYGTPARWYIEYCCDIKNKLFPNCGDPVDGGCFVCKEKTMSCYVCEECDKARDEWKKAHWETYKREHGG
jgi:hypothetical protein